MALPQYSSLRTVLGIFSLVLCAAECRADVWGDVGGALRGSPATFNKVTDPLSRMCLLTYGGTTGSHYKDILAILGVPGFNKDEDLSVDKPADKGGMRAFVFVNQEESGPVVIAYRGTDTDERIPGGQADFCFNYIMEGATLPDYCSNFTTSELDYFTQAKAVVVSAQAKYPERQIVFTGHSLGCALAAMMSVEFSTNTVGVCFSLPGVLQYTKGRTGRSEEDVRGRNNLYVLSDSNDPITTDAILVDGLFGQLFVWKTPNSKNCCTCCQVLKNRPPGGALKHPKCKTCFRSKHGFDNYLLLAGDPNLSAVLTTNLDNLKECVCPNEVTNLRTGLASRSG